MIEITKSRSATEIEEIHHLIVDLDVPNMYASGNSIIISKEDHQVIKDIYFKNIAQTKNYVEYREIPIVEKP